MSWRQLRVQTVIVKTQRVQRPDGKRERGGRVDSDGQVDGRLCVCVSRMHQAAWQVKHVADFQAQVGRQRQAVGRNRLITTLHLVRWYVDAVVEMPDLRSLDLQDQHVVVVVVGNEPSRSRRRDVGVDLYREVQLDLDGMGQRSNRAHVALNAV